MEREVEIIFEDQDLLVVNKPPFMVVTKEGRTDNNTLEDYLLREKKINLERSGIVHRLDKGTSGLLVVAKNKEALVNLKRQFKERMVKKKYMAMICGDVSVDGAISVPISRSKYGFGKFGVSVDGKMALTQFKLINKYKNQGKNYSLVDIDLKTGRTHQIRVHFSYLRWPLLGDKLYGGETNELINRPFLHSYSLSFTHPKTGQPMTFKSELADDLLKVINTYEKV